MAIIKFNGVDIDDTTKILGITRAKILGIDITSSGGFDSGLILNGTFDDDTNLIVGTDWSISGGVASKGTYTDNTNSTLTFSISENIPANTPVTLKFTSSNAVGNVRILIGGYDTGYGYADSQTAYTTYPEGQTTISWTTLNDVGRIGLSDIRIIASSAAGTFDIDNVSLTID